MNAIEAPIDHGDRTATGMLRGGLKLGHMRMIVALDDHGKVSAAAQVLNISQPAASRMIAEMEDILGVKLCERLPRGVALTPAGQALARRARAVLLEMREVDREIADLKSGKGGTVFLGSVTAPAIELAVPAIQRIREKYPRIEINIQVDTSIVLARELLASRHDFIIARIPDDLNPRLFESKVIGIEKACLIVRRGHPLDRGARRCRSTASPLMTGCSSRAARFCAGPSRAFSWPQRRLAGAHPQHHLAAPDAGHGGAIRRHRAGFDPGRKIHQSEAGLAGAIEILPIDFDIVVQPYSLITAKNRMLSPSAQLLYAEIEAHRRASRRPGQPAYVLANRHAVTCHLRHFAPEAAGLRLESRIRPGELSGKSVELTVSRSERPENVCDRSRRASAGIPLARRDSRDALAELADGSDQPRPDRDDGDRRHDDGPARAPACSPPARSAPTSISRR